MKELEERVDMMLNLQNGPDQYGSFTIDRYGYSNPYVSHGLYKYHQLTNDKRVRNGLIKHARAVRDNPPYNHEYESLLSTIHSLIVGYELSNAKSFLDEAILRSKPLTSQKIENKIVLQFFVVKKKFCTHPGLKLITVNFSDSNSAAKHLIAILPPNCFLQI